MVAWGKSWLRGRWIGALLLIGLARCTTYGMIEPGRPGSVESPIRLPSIGHELQFLESLSVNDKPVTFEFEKTVPGFDNHWMDVYEVSPPDFDSSLQEIIEKKPDAIRIYFDPYHPEAPYPPQAPPGYQIGNP